MHAIIAQMCRFQLQLYCTYQETSEYVSECEEESVSENRIKLGPSDQASTGQKESKNYEEALIKIGFGRFQYLLLFVCGLANASDAVEILCVSFVLPAAECDLNLTSADKGVLNAITFLGKFRLVWTFAISLAELFAIVQRNDVWRLHMGIDCR
jgi:hypothetical protein